MLATRLLICLAILALTTSALSAHERMQLAQAGSESSAPAATPAPGSPAQTAAPEQKLVGLAAWNKLVGNSISGTEGGKPLIRPRWRGKIHAGQRDFDGDVDARWRSDLFQIRR